MKRLLTGYWLKYQLKKIKPFDTNIKPTMSNLANGRVILKFSNSVLVQKSSSSWYTNFISNLYIVYQLNKWPRNPSNNFPVKICLFGTVKLVRNRVKSKFTYNVREIAFDGKGLWSFGNELARDVVVFDFDNSSSSHTDNKKITF